MTRETERNGRDSASRRLCFYFITKQWEDGACHRPGSGSLCLSVKEEAPDETFCVRAVEFPSGTELSGPFRIKTLAIYLIPGNAGRNVTERERERDKSFHGGGEGGKFFIIRRARLRARTNGFFFFFQSLLRDPSRESHSSIIPPCRDREAPAGDAEVTSPEKAFRRES